ncbi:TetR/AcrR family transcriptional regulator [Nocardia wallacei]|uniref:TetR/AcrR family transcriptional regulator n=1 Tax=Nocardia wallacei TaxID=480035 RepID=UPI002455777A|nr:TetR/AcrR family transcriptional regulator [Nocardia wallacei]
MPSTKDRYHHGALREELLRTSLRLIEAEGLPAVSLRRVAREAGVSPGAPYHHFADRTALLAALSTRGFELLRAELISAVGAAANPSDRLTAIADTYIRFAREQPAYFRLMFRPELSRPEKHPDTMAAGDAAFTVLTDAVAEATRAGVLPAAEADTLAMAIWALSHGLAALTVDGQLTKRAAKMHTDPAALSDRITRMFTGLIAPSTP